MEEEDSRAPSHIVPGGDYEYMSDGYYACLEADANGLKPVPSCADTLDAYVVPIALEKAALAGIAVPDWYLTNEYFKPPAILYGVNPFARNHLVVTADQGHEAAAKKLSRTGKFVICVQEIPEGAEILEFRQILGSCSQRKYEVLAANVFETFRLPLSLVRVIETKEKVMLSAVERLPVKRLTKGERSLLNMQLFKLSQPHG